MVHPGLCVCVESKARALVLCRLYPFACCVIENKTVAWAWRDQRFIVAYQFPAIVTHFPCVIAVNQSDIGRFHDNLAQGTISVVPENAVDVVGKSD